MLELSPLKSEDRAAGRRGETLMKGARPGAGGAARPPLCNGASSCGHHTHDQTGQLDADFSQKTTAEVCSKGKRSAIKRVEEVAPVSSLHASAKKLAQKFL